ncbi:MAG TPA: hypothetical protein VLK25_13590 [Allosphingosinicella sp.]|nr:hypothetical protein [Allosphingosinicella sp.]
MTARTQSAPDRRRIVGSWILTVVLAFLSLTTLTQKAEASAGAPPAPAVETARAA